MLFRSMWIMVIGGLGIAMGLALYGPKLIKTVGSEITDLDRSRAFCVAISAVIAVLVASQLGLPVSSTHVAIGAVFGIGFYREYLKKKLYKMQRMIIDAYSDKDEATIDNFLHKFNSASLKKKKLMLESVKNIKKQSKTGEKREKIYKAHRGGEARKEKSTRKNCCIMANNSANFCDSWGIAVLHHHICGF